MDKRYQVFVSSTYTDLLEARAEVMQALLELNCMPAGMELFPAANEEQWSWIKRVIDESDYYLVVVAGRYGSIAKSTGLAYTEMEYRYALETKKPVIGFLHSDPVQLAAKHCEQTDDGRTKLASFRDLVGSKLCKMWTTPADLGAKVSRSLTQLMKAHPAVGWVRSDAIPSEEMLGLRRKVYELQAHLDQVSIQGPAGVEDLSRGKDHFAIWFGVDHLTRKSGKQDHTYWVKLGREDYSVEFTWDEIFAHIAPTFLENVEDYNFVNVLNSLIQSRAMHELQEKWPNERFKEIKIHKESFDTIKVQLRALGLITTSGDVHTWALTPYGDQYMTKLLAVRRQAPKHAPPKKRSKT